MVFGRPTVYKPEFCQRVIELGKLGKSLAGFACEFEVTRETLYEWAKKYSEFSDALTLAKTFSMQWWENTAQERMIEEPGGLKLNQGIWARSMAARFPDDYRENSGVNVTTNVNLPTNIPDDQRLEAHKRYILEEAEKIREQMKLDNNTIDGRLAIEDQTSSE